MGKKNVVFTKDGVRVGVKHVQNEKYVDKTQSWVVKAWNLGQPKQEEELYVNNTTPLPRGFQTSIELQNSILCLVPC